MKKFFRALALVLALVLVIGTVPATQASAKVKKSKTLYVGGAQGESTDGELKSAIKGKVALYKLAGYTSKTKKGHEISAKIKSGKDIVDVTSKYVVAEAFGKAVVTLTVDGVKYDVVINVKANATAKTLTIEGLEEKAVIGVEYEVALPRAGKDSDERRLVTDAKEGVEIKDGASARKYLVTFTKEGTYNITAEAFQSEVLDKAIVSKTIEVKAGLPQVVSAKQVSANSFAVTFDGKMTGIFNRDKVKNENIYTLVGDTHVVTGVVKSADPSKDDPTQVVITMYSNFAEGETYYFVYGDSEPVSFKAAKNLPTEVDTIALVPADHFYLNEAGALTVKYYNADGVELDVASKVFPSFSFVSGSEYAYLAGNNVTFFTAGVATVKATVILGYDEANNYAEIKKDATATITGTDKPVAVAVSNVYSFGVEAKKEAHNIRLGAAAAALNVSFLGADGKEVGKYTSGDTGYKLKSANESIAMIDGTGKVIGVNTGSTTIILYTVDNNGTETAKAAFPIVVMEKNHGTSNVTANFVNNKTNLNLDMGETTTLEVVVKDLDGNNYDPTKYTVEVAQVNDNNATAVGVAFVKTAGTADTTNKKQTVLIQEKTDTVTTGNLDVKGGSETTITTKGTASVVLTVTVKEGNTTLLTKNVTVVLAKGVAAKATYAYRLVADKTVLDNSVKKYDKNPADKATIKIEKVAIVNGSQFTAGVENARFIKSIANIPATCAAASTDTIVNYIIPTVKGNAGVLADGLAIADANGNYLAGPFQNITVANFSQAATATDSAIELKATAAGTYSFSAIRMTYDKDGKFKSREQIGTVAVVVSGTNAVATYTEQAGLNAEKLSGLVVGVTPVGDKYAVDDTKAKALFKVAYDGLNSADNSDRIQITSMTAKVDDATKAVYVYSLGVRIKPVKGYNEYIDTTITVEKLYKDNK